MALQYWQNAGEPQRNRFIRLTAGYHGDTIGAMSLSDIAVFKERFSEVTFETRTLTNASYRGPTSRASLSSRSCKPHRVCASCRMKCTMRCSNETADHLRRNRHRLRQNRHDVCFRTNAAGT